MLAVSIFFSGSLQRSCLSVSIISDAVYFSIGAVTVTSGIAFGFLDPTLTNHLEDVTNVSAFTLQKNEVFH